MHSKKFTVIGNGNYNILVIPNERVMGTIYGKTLRKLALEFQNIKFWIPNNDYHTNDIDVNLIIATDLPKYLAQKKCDVILLNPRHEYNNFGESHLEIYRGEFSASSHKNIQNESNYTLLEGVGDFIPSWSIIIEKKLSSIFIP